MYDHILAFGLGLLIAFAYIWIGIFTHATFNKKPFYNFQIESILIVFCIIWPIYWMIWFVTVFLIIGFYLIKKMLSFKYGEIFTKSAIFLGGWFNKTCNIFSDWLHRDES